MNILIVSVCSWAIAQLLKIFVALAEKKPVDFRTLISTGGMPSSHSALVSALATSVAIVEGLDSTLFAISIVFALIVMYDAAGLRRSVGKQAVVLNRIVQELINKRLMAEFGHELRELIGHTFIQVFAGAFLGITVSCIWFIWLE
jgi:hypothetical protein